jgi:hypothetical protein
MSKRTWITVILTSGLLGMSAAAGQTIHPLAKAGVGDWAEYLFNSQNKTVPMLSVKDQKQWRVVSAVTDSGVRIDHYLMINDSRTGPLGSVIDLAKPFEPVEDLAQGAKIDIVSTTPESLTVNGKTYACTKIVRRVSRAADLTKGQTGWKGTSTVWLCPDIPAGGIVRIENSYESRFADDAEPNTVVETLALADFGFKNWQE